MSRTAVVIYCWYIDEYAFDIIKDNPDKDIFVIPIMDPNLSHAHGKALEFELLSNYELNFILSGICDGEFEKYKKYDTKAFTSSFPTANLYSWPFGLLNLSYDIYLDLIGKKIPSEEDLQYIQLNKLYLNKTSRPRNHRIRLLDELSNKNLIEYGINTFINPDNQKFEHKNWYPYLKDVDKYLYDWSSNSYGGITQEYIDHSALIEVITETEIDYLRFSEKTWKPILNLRPFLIVGAKHIHKKLKELGFYLYENIFDYEFDDKDNVDDRICGVVNNLEKLKDLDVNKLYKLERDAIIHNIQHLRKSVIFDDSIDVEFINKLQSYSNIEIISRVSHEYHRLLSSVILSNYKKKNITFGKKESLDVDNFNSKRKLKQQILF